nr:hypothetical protein [Kineococcus vitellinus]
MSTDQVAAPASAVSNSTLMSSQASGKTSRTGRPSAAGCLSPMSAAYAVL